MRQIENDPSSKSAVKAIAQNTYVKLLNERLEKDGGHLMYRGRYIYTKKEPGWDDIADPEKL